MKSEGKLVWLFNLYSRRSMAYARLFERISS